MRGGRLAHRNHFLRMHLNCLPPNAGTLLEGMGLEDFRKPAADETQSKCWQSASLATSRPANLDAYQDQPTHRGGYLAIADGGERALIKSRRPETEPSQSLRASQQ